MTPVWLAGGSARLTWKLGMVKALTGDRMIVQRAWEKAAPKSRLYVRRRLLSFLGGFGRVAFAGFVRCRIVDLADVVGLDRKGLVLNAVSRVCLGLDLAFSDNRRPGLKSSGELRQRTPNLNLEPIGVLVLGAVLVFPLLVDGNAEVVLDMVRRVNC